MPVKYLLDCSCGEKIEVGPVQAGQVVQCVCGASVEVPTMRKMTSLQRVRPDKAPRRPGVTWGIRHKLVFIGVVIALGALGCGGCLFLSRPVPPETAVDAEMIRRATDSFTPVQSWQIWQWLRRGLSDTPSKALQRYRAELATYHARMIAVAAFTALGVLIITGALLTPRSLLGGSRKRVKRPRPKASGQQAAGSGQQAADRYQDL